MLRAPSPPYAEVIEDVVYHGRVAARPAEPGTSGRGSRKIGVSY